MNIWRRQIVAISSMEDSENSVQSEKHLCNAPRSYI